jgi:hypothetical protein
MRVIFIKETPEGFAPLEIREAWVGCTIPFPTKEELARNPPSGMRAGSANVGGYRVTRKAAIRALRENEKDEAADFWDNLPFGEYLIFAKKVCTLVKR